MKPKSRRQDPDLAKLTVGQLRQLVMKLRRRLRWHRDLQDNARCWHADLQLYEVLPEQKPAGKMRGDEKVLLRNCKAYIRRQQCDTQNCDGCECVE